MAEKPGTTKGLNVFRYRIALPRCRPGNWYTTHGVNVREALHVEAAKGCNVDDDPIRIEVEDHGFWWLSRSTEINTSITRESASEGAKTR
jgi:hypothetical protein